MKCKNYVSSSALFFILSFLHFSCINDESKIEGPFSVKIITPDFLSTYGTIYELDKDSIKVTVAGHMEGKVDSIIYLRPLSTEEKKSNGVFF